MPSEAKWTQEAVALGPYTTCLTQLGHGISADSMIVMKTLITLSNCVSWFHPSCLGPKKITSTPSNLTPQRRPQ